MATSQRRPAGHFRRAVSAALTSTLLLVSPSSAEGPRRAVALAVDTDPAGARLFIDGRYAGETPAELVDLPSGTHRVRLEKRGYLENARTIEVSGAHSAHLRVTLTPIHGAGEQVVASGGGAGSKKWLWVGIAAAAGGAGAAFALKGKENLSPVIGSVSVQPSNGLQGATEIGFSAVGASDADGDALTYNWDFGDGTTGSGATATHRFATAGTFTATVNVTDGKHTVSARGSVTIVSLTGTWRGQNAAYTVTITHAGSVLAVVWDDVTNGLSRRWSGSGTVVAPRSMTAVLNPTLNVGGSLTLNAALDSSNNVLSGTVAGFVTPFALDVRRQ